MPDAMPERHGTFPYWPSVQAAPQQKFASTLALVNQRPYTLGVKKIAAGHYEHGTWTIRRTPAFPEQVRERWYVAFTGQAPETCPRFRTLKAAQEWLDSR